MSLEKSPVISPYEKNAKKHTQKQINALCEIVKEVGWRQPVLVNKNGVIIVGHGRYETWLQNKDILKQIWIINDSGETICGGPDTREMTPEQEKAYRLADNKLNESEWDMKLVTEELSELNLAGMDIKITGFEKDLILSSDEADDIVPGVPDVPTSKLGEIYQLGNHRIMCGDSTDLESVERLMNGEKANMVFTDPPYNVDYSKDRKIKNDKLSDEKWNEFVTGFVTNLLMFCSGALYICMSSKEWGSIQNAFNRGGGHWSKVIIWVKDRFVMSRGDYHSQFEPIMLLNDQEEEPEEEGTPILYGWKEGETRKWHSDRKQTDIWRIKRPTSSKEHPTMKPVELCLKAVKNSSEPGDLVLDLFLGSGTTLIACEKAERICYGMELDPKYLDVIIKRWEKYTGLTAKKI